MNAEQEAGGDDRSLEELAHALWAGRRLVGALGLIATTAAVGLALMLPPTYEAVTTVIPVPRESSRIPFQTGVAPEELAGLLGGAPQRTMMYPDLVRSRRLLEGLLFTRFARASEGDSAALIDLVQPGGRGALRVEKALRRLRRFVDATTDRRTGILTIRVRSQDPAVAAGVANLLVMRLQEFSIQSMAGNAAENRRFIEGRLAETRTELARAEASLEVFREGNLRIGNSPRLQLELGRRMRDVRAQEEVFLALTREYELARVAEHRDVPVINTLDSAAVPASRSAPRRGLMAAVGCVIGVGLGAFLVLARQGMLPR